MRFKAHKLSSHGPSGKPVDTATITAVNANEAMSQARDRWPYSAVTVEPAGATGDVEELTFAAYEAVFALLNELGDRGMLEDAYTDGEGALDVSHVIEAHGNMSAFVAGLS